MFRNKDATLAIKINGNHIPAPALMDKSPRAQVVSGRPLESAAGKESKNILLITTVCEMQSLLLDGQPFSQFVGLFSVCLCSQTQRKGTLSELARRFNSFLN